MPPKTTPSKYPLTARVLAAASAGTSVPATAATPTPEVLNALVPRALVDAAVHLVRFCRAPAGSDALLLQRYGEAPIAEFHGTGDLTAAEGAAQIVAALNASEVGSSPTPVATPSTPAAPAAATTTKDVLGGDEELSTLLEVLFVHARAALKMELRRRWALIRKHPGRRTTLMSTSGAGGPGLNDGDTVLSEAPADGTPPPPPPGGFPTTGESQLKTPPTPPASTTTATMGLTTIPSMSAPRAGAAATANAENHVVLSEVESSRFAVQLANHRSAARNVQSQPLGTNPAKTAALSAARSTRYVRLSDAAVGVDVVVDVRTLIVFPFEEAERASKKDSNLDLKPIPRARLAAIASVTWDVTCLYAQKHAVSELCTVLRESVAAPSDDGTPYYAVASTGPPQEGVPPAESAVCARLLCLGGVASFELEKSRRTMTSRPFSQTIDPSVDALPSTIRLESAGQNTALARLDGSNNWWLLGRWRSDEPIASAHAMRLVRISPARATAFTAAAALRGPNSMKAEPSLRAISAEPSLIENGTLSAGPSAPPDPFSLARREQVILRLAFPAINSIFEPAARWLLSFDPETSPDEALRVTAAIVRQGLEDLGRVGPAAAWLNTGACLGNDTLHEAVLEHLTSAPLHLPEERIGFAPQLLRGGPASPSKVVVASPLLNSFDEAAGQATEDDMSFFVLCHADAGPADDSTPGPQQRTFLPRLAADMIRKGAATYPNRRGRVLWRGKWWMCDAAYGVLIPEATPQTASTAPLQPSQSTAPTFTWLGCVLADGTVVTEGPFAVPAALFVVHDAPVRIPWAALRDTSFPVSLGSTATAIDKPSLDVVTILEVDQFDAGRFKETVSALLTALEAIDAGKALPRAVAKTMDNNGALMAYLGFHVGELQERARSNALSVTVSGSPGMPSGSTGLMMTTPGVSPGASPGAGKPLFPPSAASGSPIVPRGAVRPSRSRGATVKVGGTALNDLRLDTTVQQQEASGGRPATSESPQRAQRLGATTSGTPPPAVGLSATNGHRTSSPTRDHLGGPGSPPEPAHGRFISAVQDHDPGAASDTTVTDRGPSFPTPSQHQQQQQQPAEEAKERIDGLFRRIVPSPTTQKQSHATDRTASAGGARGPTVAERRGRAQPSVDLKFQLEPGAERQ